MAAEADLYLIERCGRRPDPGHRADTMSSHDTDALDAHREERSADVVTGRRDEPAELVLGPARGAHGRERAARPHLPDRTHRGRVRDAPEADRQDLDYLMLEVDVGKDEAASRFEDVTGKPPKLGPRRPARART